MYVMPVQTYPPLMQRNFYQELQFLTNNLGQNTQLPDEKRNYTLFNQDLVGRILSYGEMAVPFVVQKITTSNDEKTIAEGLYTIDRMIDAGAKDIYKIYPSLSKFNETESPTIKVLLAGIYRKTQVPDAFGPLCKMLVKESMKPTPKEFDPTEEIGGAILEYIRTYSAKELWGKIPVQTSSVY